MTENMSDKQHLLLATSQGDVERRAVKLGWDVTHEPGKTILRRGLREIVLEYVWRERHLDFHTQLISAQLITRLDMGTRHKIDEIDEWLIQYGEKS